MAVLSSPTLCLLGIFISSSFLGAEAKLCGKDWEEYNGYCYILPSEKVSWQEAAIKCMDRGAQLVSIHTAEETNWVSKYLIKQKMKEDVWIGIRNCCSWGNWRWIDRTSYKYKAWDNPNHKLKPEICGLLLPKTDFKKWGDANCKELKHYLCYYKI